ncbi:MAG: YybH family protein [Terriglobales bacterium]
MRSLANVVIWIFALCVLCGAQAQTPQGIKSNKDVPEFLRQLADTRKTIADGYVRWTEAMKAKDVQAVSSLYKDDATILPDDGEPVSGKEAIRVFYRDWYSSTDKLIEQNFENVNSWQTGNVIVDSTKYSGVLVKEGKGVPFRGKRLVVWTREFQGPWKIARDIWNKSPMPGN